MENLFKIMDKQNNNVEKLKKQKDRWNINRFLSDKQKRKQPAQGHPKMEHHTRIRPLDGLFLLIQFDIGKQRTEGCGQFF